MLIACSFKRTSLRATPKRLSGSVSPESPERNARIASSIDVLLNEAMSAAN